MNKEKAIERINENLETVNVNKGKIRFNSVWFSICSGIGLVATGVGIAGCVVLGPAVAPIATTAVGLASMIVPGAIKSYENKQYDEYTEIANEQKEQKARIIRK